MPNNIDKFLEDNSDFPDLYKLYNLIPVWVTKTDLARLLIIYYNGGIYCDVDCFIKKSFHNNSNVYLFTESILSNVNQLGDRECKNTENKLRIANYCFASKLNKHPFFKEVIEECIKRLNQILIIENRTNLTHSDILWCCGPDVITSVYHLTKNKYKDIFLGDTSFLQHNTFGSWR